MRAEEREEEGSVDEDCAETLSWKPMSRGKEVKRGDCHPRVLWLGLCRGEGWGHTSTQAHQHTSTHGWNGNGNGNVVEDKRGKGKEEGKRKGGDG